MKKLLYILVIGVGLTSCTKEEFEIETNYQFEMTGRTSQDINGYYHLQIDPAENQQSLHRFGAYVTSTDKWNLPTKIIWKSNTFWHFDNMTVPIVNGVSHADPLVDSAYCMMAPIGSMVGDTVTIYGQAWFEEGDIILNDSINVIFEYGQNF
tara:strand:+ start:833 stop:1288 length:456 start_codon:yes stop_codon:yes gene_type:complete